MSVIVLFMPGSVHRVNKKGNWLQLLVATKVESIHYSAGVGNPTLSDLPIVGEIFLR